MNGLEAMAKEILIGYGGSWEDADEHDREASRKIARTALNAAEKYVGDEEMNAFWEAYDSVSFLGGNGTCFRAGMGAALKKMVEG